MSYLDRLRECRYTTPSGTTFTVKYTTVSRSGGKKAPVHEMPQQDTPEIQDLGNTGQRFPLTMIFDGADYDLAADAFIRGLAESGPGTLLHPTWGDLTVMPLTWSETRNFVEGMGNSTIEVEFARADAAPRWPVSARAIEAELPMTLDAAADSAAAAFASAFAPAGAIDVAAVKSQVTSGVTAFYAKLKGAIAESAEEAETFRTSVNAFTANIDTLVNDPVTMAQDFLALTRIPGQVATDIVNKVAGYRDAITTLGDTLNPATLAQGALAFLQYAGALLGLADSSTAGTLSDREDAASAAGGTQDAGDAGITGIETIEGLSGYEGGADVVTAVKQGISSAAALLLEKSFTLRAARRFTLTSARTPMDLVYDLMGPTSGDEMEADLDEFCTQNALEGDELIMIPAGRELSYYAR